jgi:hypothetical protein
MKCSPGKKESHEPLRAVEPVGRDNDRGITLVALGDLAFHGHYHRRLARGVEFSPLRSFTAAWRGADLRTGNLESPLTSHPRATSSKLALRGTKEAAGALRQAGVDVVALANNHMMDFGPEGIEETRTVLQAGGVESLGAGPQSDSAASPWIREIRGKRVGLLAWCDVQQASRLYATPDSPGVARWNLDVALQQVAQLRPKVDWLVVHLHWGLEYSELPTPDQRATARRLAQAGVDVIVGHHPHVIQPAEVIGQTAVLYSLGNFTFSPLRWRGINAAGNPFTARKRMPALAARTGWAEVRLGRRSPPRILFHPARLRRDLAVVPDNHPGRSAYWDQLNRQLEKAGYDERFQVEAQRAAERNDWTGQWRTCLGRLELKLFQHGLLTGAGDAG